MHLPQIVRRRREEGNKSKKLVGVAAQLMKEK